MLARAFITAILKTLRENIPIEIKTDKGNTIKITYSSLLNKVDKDNLNGSSIEELTPATIARIVWKEEKEEELQKLSKDFYAKCSILLRKMEKDINDKNFIVYSKNIMLIKSNLLDLIKYRTQKIVKLALLSPTPQRDLINKMTIEEELLYLMLCNILSSWNQFIVENLVGR